MNEYTKKSGVNICAIKKGSVYVCGSINLNVCINACKYANLFLPIVQTYNPNVA